MCGICGKIDNNWLCKKCELDLKKEAVFKIEEKEEYFQNHLYIFPYEGRIRKMILEYKFQEKTYLAKTIVNFLLKDEKFFEILKSYDTIIPVPISKKRNKQRGYNQSELIAKEIGRFFNIAYVTNCLFKRQDTIEQSKLNKEERLNNIQNVYEIKNAKYLEKKSILLLDDIYTTGSTANECAKQFEKINIKKIDVLTIAKD